MREQVRLRKALDRLLLDEQAARIDTEMANARLLLLVEGSKRLSRSLSVGDTLETLAAVVVPSLAEWSCVVHKGWNDEPAFATLAHGDPNRQELMRLLRSYRPDPIAPEGASRVFRTGEVSRYDDITPEQLSQGSPGWPIVGTRDPECLHAMRELGMKSLLCVPIRGKQGVDAVCMLVSASDPRRYTNDDVVLAQDLADRAAVALENGRLLSEALEAVRARDDFLAVAAHELRTPLTAMLLQLNLAGRRLADDRNDLDPARGSVGAAEAQGRRLSTLIDGLLDVSRFTAGRLVIHVEDFDLRGLIDSVVASLATRLQSAGCTVSVDAPKRVLGRWDRTRIGQVLSHVLLNAMKFGAGCPIEVGVDATETSVRVSVRDHGMGISADDRARIFGRFERAVPTQHFGGLGLGLCTSVQILRAHQGTLRVDSQPGQGACFIIELPTSRSGP